MKTLDQVEARIPVDANHTPGDLSSSFIINAAGSYYLTGNLTGSPSKTGISITSDNVTVDLNGFALVGPGGSTIGIDCGGQKNVVIRNGTIRSWATAVFSSGASTKLRFATIQVLSNPTAGFALGADSQIIDCIIDGSASGITTGSNCTVSNCYLTFCSIGITAGPGNTISGCSIASGLGTGIVANNKCLIKDSYIASNSAKGIDTITNGGTEAQTTIQNCQVIGNASHGIDLSGSCVVRDCVIQPGGSGEGINIGSSGVGGAWIYNNQIRNAASGHNGLKCSSSNNRIDGNTFARNNTAIVTDGTSANNIITRNVFLSNTNNFVNTSMNAQRQAQTLSFSAGQVSTDPWANIQ